MPPPIFTSSQPTKALVTLVLIENSQLLYLSWGALRQHYLPTLLGTMRIANPVIPIPVLWLTTAPVGDDPASIRSPPPRQYNQLPDLKFSFSPDNKITSRIINRATELMLEAATQFHDGPVGFHLFIVAASPPIQGTWGVSSTAPAQMGHSEWRLVAQRIAQLRMHCHMILPASQDMSPMNDLFNTTLQLQGHTQVAPWFPTSAEYTLLLSGDPSSHMQPHSDSPLPPLDPPSTDPIENMPATDPPQNPSLVVTRPPVLRHQSFPQDAPSPIQSGSAPSLVSSLQKVHGLSRKKLYGTQPPRQPFVREEPVRSKYKSTPTPLSIPVGSQHLSISEEGRVGKVKGDRGRRADRPARAPDASSSCSPVRRSSGTYVPSDMGSSPSSPATSLSSHAPTSPTIPLYPDLAGYPTTPSATFTPTVLPSVPIPETDFVSPFGDPSGGYFSLSPLFQTPPSTAIPASPQTPVWAPIPKPSPMLMAKTPTSHRRHSQEFAHGSHVQSLSAMSSKYRLDTPSAEPRPAPKSTQKVKDAGDVPFIFSPELEAETAARLKAALQSTTPVSAGATMNQYSAFGQVNYTALEEYGLPQTPMAGYDGVQDACSAGLMSSNVHCGDARPRFVGSTSSSLQGWAG